MSSTPANIPLQPAILQKLSSVNEQAWLTLGNLAEMMLDYERAMNSYESALRQNPYSIPALSHIASLYRGKEQFAKAVEYFKRILALQESNGETWSALGHCYLMLDNLQEAYQAYQQALYHLQSPKDPKLWYGIGILYDRYGSIEHAEEAFSAVMKMDPKFEKANEIYFRLGIIYKQQQKFDLSLQCFCYILRNPPKPLTEIDIWFQTGHVYEQQKEYEHAKEAYERVLNENPDHAKVLQQLGWLYHQQNTSFSNQSTAIQYLTRSLKADSADAQSWYLLGRCYMVEQNYNKAYEAYQQAVYRDARNPTFWCSIGVLYYQINQYRDALDAYSRAIRLNPYISEVWYDLGTLYESCNNQIQDALDAYQRASELDPTNPHIKQRLELLRKSNPSHPPPAPQDVNNPYQYQNASALPPSNNPPPPPPLVSGPQQGNMDTYPPTPSRSYPRMEPIPRDLPLPSPNHSQDHRSPIPLNHPDHASQDIRIPDIRQQERYLIDAKSPIYRASQHQKMANLVRSPILTNKPSPKLPPTPNGGPSNYNSPRQDPYYKPEEPLRRTSVLYDSEKSSPHIKRETLPPPVHHRTSSSNNSSKKSSPIENSAADTLMSMAQQRHYTSQKRVLEMADDEDDGDNEAKKPRSENRLLDISV